jgi:hypothetical protein
MPTRAPKRDDAWKKLKQQKRNSKNSNNIEMVVLRLCEESAMMIAQDAQYSLADITEGIAP